MSATRAPAAAIDLGTNTALMVVARVAADGGLEVVDDLCETARLGEGLASTGKLDPTAVERTLAILERFLRRARELDVGAMRAVGTAVLRRAEDAADFISTCHERLGLAVEVLSEEEEARLGWRAVSMDSGAKDTIVVDVGGGSTELVADHGAERTSVPIGALVLTERYFGLDDRPPVSAGGWDALWGEVVAACGAFPDVALEGGVEVALLGGTAANLACLDLGLPAFDHLAAEGHIVAAGSARRWADRLAALSPAQRLSMPIEADRAGILPAGLACAAGALERIGCDRVRVTGRGLRYGVVRELIG